MVVLGVLKGHLQILGAEQWDSVFSSWDRTEQNVTSPVQQWMQLKQYQCEHETQKWELPHYMSIATLLPSDSAMNSIPLPRVHDGFCCTGKSSNGQYLEQYVNSSVRIVTVLQWWRTLVPSAPFVLVSQHLFTALCWFLGHLSFRPAIFMSIGRLLQVYSLTATFKKMEVSGYSQFKVSY